MQWHIVSTGSRLLQIHLPLLVRERARAREREGLQAGALHLRVFLRRPFRRVSLARCAHLADTFGGAILIDRDSRTIPLSPDFLLRGIVMVSSWLQRWPFVIRGAIIAPTTALISLHVQWWGFLMVRILGMPCQLLHRLTCIVRPREL